MRITVTEIAKALMQLRETLGLSQAEMARKLGLHRVTYHRWEKGETSPAIDTLVSHLSQIKISLSLEIDAEHVDTQIAALRAKLARLEGRISD